MVDDLVDLRDRLNEKADTLDYMAGAAEQKPDPMSTSVRLRGKAEGVRLAISFVDEMIREQR